MFMCLKLIGIVDWSWWFVFIPIYVKIAILAIGNFAEKFGCKISILQSHGMRLLEAMTAMFICLQLIGVLNCSWILVFFPLVVQIMLESVMDIIRYAEQ